MIRRACPVCGCLRHRAARAGFDLVICKRCGEFLYRSELVWWRRKRHTLAYDASGPRVPL